MKLTPHAASLRQLQYVVAVAESLSFRKAAERCRVSQPSLSAQVAALERALGAHLFERDRRRVLVTAAGAEIVEHARRVLREAEDLVEAAARSRDPLAGTLRVGVIPTISPYLLPIIAPALRAAYPRLALRWLEEKTTTLLRDLEAGSLEAALLALEAEIGDVEREMIAVDVFFLATAKGHPLGTAGGPARPGDLAGAGVLLLDDGHCFRDQALAFCSRARARELEFRATSLPTLAQMVAGGAGVTLLPALAAPAEARSASLRLRPFAAPAPHRTIGLVWRGGSPLASTLRQIAGTIREAYPAARRRPASARRPASSGSRRGSRARGGRP